jgi:hypothetical protein
MAVVVTAQPANNNPRAFSIGPYKIEFASVTSGISDTSVAVTAQSMSTVVFAILSGEIQTAAATYSGATATFTVDGTAAGAGQVLLVGV